MGQEDFARYIIGTNSGSFEWSSLRRTRKKRSGKVKQFEYDDEHRFDLRIAQRWIMRRVIDLGWTTELFGEFDRRVTAARYDRAAHKSERIGKKYQWLAYHEFLARVSDNFEFTGDRWAKKNEAYDGPWQAGFVRDIDPSCLIRKTATDAGVSCWWQPEAYHAWDAVAEDAEWIRQSDDLADPSASIQVVDEKGVEWLALESYSSFDQPRVEEDFEYRSPRRYVWRQIRSYFVRRHSTKKFLEWAKTQDFMGRWMPESSEAHQLFIGEYFWSAAYRYLQQPYYSREAWSSRTSHGQHALPAPVALTTDGYSHSGGYDCSIEDSINILLPSEILVNGLQLKWNTRPGEYSNGAGTLVVQYPTTYKAGPAAVLVRKDALLQFLRDKNLGVVWTVLGEKGVLTYDQRGWPGRLERSGAYALQNGRFAGTTHHKFVGPHSTS
jgi:hypothetical protein